MGCVFVQRRFESSPGFTRGSGSVHRASHENLRFRLDYAGFSAYYSPGFDERKVRAVEPDRETRIQVLHQFLHREVLGGRRPPPQLSYNPHRERRIPRRTEVSESRPYSPHFTPRRRREIRRRDKFRCQLCGMPQRESHERWGRRLHVHHIDYDKENSDPVNLVSLCCICHGRTNIPTNQDHWTAFFRKQSLARQEEIGVSPTA